SGAITGGLSLLTAFAGYAASGPQSGPGNQYGPLAGLVGFVPTLVGTHKFDIPGRPLDPGDLHLNQGAFETLSSTTIGPNEGAHAFGVEPTLKLFGQFLQHDITFTAGVNVRYLPALQQFRVQESVGLDFNLARFRLGPYPASLGLEGRANIYQQID